MSISYKIYKGIVSIKDFVSRKAFYNSLLFCLSLLFFFGVLNVYAQEDVKITPDFEGTKQFHNQVSGADINDDNMASSGGLQLMNSAWLGVSLLGGEEISEYSELIKHNPNIPYDLKRGVLGLASDAGDFAYAIYPTVNVPEHLAQQWVPGYAENSVSLYAATHDSGYQVLTDSGIVGLWNRVLNLSYVVFVIIMIIAGFMIMFRHKLGGQTMVTIGNVLPGVIVALVLATFSFAIAGLIIDLGGVLTGLLVFIFGEGGMEAGSIATLGGLMKAVMGWGVFIGGGVTSGSLVLGGKGLTAVISKVIGSATKWLWLGKGVTILGTIGLILLLVVLGIIVVGAIKVLIALYKALFSLLISVILAPIQITAGALPGNSHMIKNWFLSILRNVLVFPVVLFIVNIPTAIQKSGDKLLLSFPGKLVNSDPNVYDPDGLNATSGFLLFILKIFVLYFAAQAPKFLESWFPPSSPKAVGEGMAAAKASLSKIPLIGSMFK
ncbi:MAG: hypothetical protein ACOX0X_01310 [Candidatus Dojkabacteria bacterium]|jgi:hypothetical protein